jgi:hypothetical protein
MHVIYVNLSNQHGFLRVDNERDGGFMQEEFFGKTLRVLTCCMQYLIQNTKVADKACRACLAAVLVA